MESNVQKMRKALEKIVELTAPCEGVPSIELQVQAEALDAISAPPRNCDRFQTKDAAREAFQKLRKHRVWADVSLWDDRDEIELFLDWLFANEGDIDWANIPYEEDVDEEEEGVADGK